MFELLVRASIGGAVVAGIMWVLCRVLPGLSPGTRALLWWCAAAKFVIALVWVAPVQVPVLPAGVFGGTGGAFGGTKVPPYVESATDGADVNPSSLDAVTSQASARPAAQSAAGVAPYEEVVVGAWGVGAFIALAVVARRWRRMRDVVRQSAPACWQTQAMAEELSTRLGVSQAPDVRVSNLVSTPIVAGLRQPVVVLPEDRFSRLSLPKQRMAICHELAHIKRRDLALGCVPALAERLFFFHPLAILAAREYALWREAACDEVVLNVLDAAPNDYGRLLLDLGVTRPHVGLAAAGAPWSFPNLKRRLVMLGRPSVTSTWSRSLAASAIVVALAAVLPLQLVGREHTASADAEVSLAREAAVSLPTPGPMANRSADQAAPPSTGQPARHDHARHSADHDKSHHDLRFTLFVDDNDIMHGSWRDHERAKRFRRGAEPMVWFQHEGKEYVIRDRNVVSQAAAIWRPIGELGAEQGKLGAQQGALGAKQGEYGAKQGALGAKQGQLGSRMGQLGARQAELALRGTRDLPEAERRELEREQQKLEAEMEAVGKEMEKLGEEMEALGRPMDDLGSQMEPLGKEMEVLGRKMEEASRKAEAEMRALIQRAVKDGTAEEVR